MKDLTHCITQLQAKILQYRKRGLREAQTRTTLIDPVLRALDWDVEDPDIVELEYPTVDGKAVDYALKLNRKPVLLVEAKAMQDPLDDVKAVTQVVGYAANDGIGWCVLTNGVCYKVYSVKEQAAAPEKLLFEVSLDPREHPEQEVQSIASRLARLSRDAIASGELDALGEKFFTTTKVRKALRQLCLDPPSPFLRVLRKQLGPGVAPQQIKEALVRVERALAQIEEAMAEEEDEARQVVQRSKGRKGRRGGARGPQKGRVYTEAQHTTGAPAEIDDLYRSLDRFCRSLAPAGVERAFLAKYIRWSLGNAIFCSAQLQQQKLRVWLKLDPGEIPAGIAFARDVSRVGHHGVGDVELTIPDHATLTAAEPVIRQAFAKVAHL
ncbi:hypothetical protein D6833_05460 [Candidatus Parcubacteria bacterium]|nr:MAG: hypothetical protein D6833_05460 [Candidatus Parcubacteria bacterium]